MQRKPITMWAWFDFQGNEERRGHLEIGLEISQSNWKYFQIIRKIFQIGVFDHVRLNYSWILQFLLKTHFCTHRTQKRCVDVDFCVPCERSDVLRAKVSKTASCRLHFPGWARTSVPTGDVTPAQPLKFSALRLFVGTLLPIDRFVFCYRWIGFPKLTSGRLVSEYYIPIDWGPLSFNVCVCVSMFLLPCELSHTRNNHVKHLDDQGLSRFWSSREQFTCRTPQPQIGLPEHSWKQTPIQIMFL